MEINFEMFFCCVIIFLTKHLKNSLRLVEGVNMKKVEPCFNMKGKLVLVSAMTSNKSGIGKTTISIGLADGLSKIGKKLEKT